MRVQFLLLVTTAIVTNCHRTHSLNEYVETTDITNFWAAYDKITATHDSVLQLKYLDSLYFQQGTPGLAGIRQARNYSPQEYLNAINSYPKFWNSIRANTLEAQVLNTEFDEGIQKLGNLYPDLRPAKIYFTIGALRTGGTTMDSMVLIGAEISMTDSLTDASEFPEEFSHLPTHFATNPKKHLVFLNIHEYVHTQQTPIEHNILSLVIYEGVAEFVAVKALGVSSPNPQIAFGKANADRIRAVFEQEMFYPNNLYKWLHGNSPNEFGMRDLGYSVGYEICEHYYNQASDKMAAIKTMIELDYANEAEVEEFVRQSNYFSAPLEVIYENFEKSRPYVTSIKQFENKSQNVSPHIKEITVQFSQPLNGMNTGVDLGPLGQDAFPKGTINGRFWSEDNLSWTIPVTLEPNKQYQILISNNFRTEKSIPLKAYLIEFATGPA
ncbi:MAG: hypothetical protein R2795_06595 [Saprospiraceae bacterium]